MAEAFYAKAEGWLFERIALPMGHPLRLTHLQALVWLRLAWYAGAKGEAWPSQQRLAKDLGCGARAIREAIDVLVKQGLLGRCAKQIRGKGNVYELRSPCASQRIPGSSDGEAAHGQRHAGSSEPASAIGGALPIVTADPPAVADHVRSNAGDSAHISGSSLPDNAPIVGASPPVPSRVTERVTDRGSQDPSQRILGSSEQRILGSSRTRSIEQDPGTRSTDARAPARATTPPPRDVESAVVWTIGLVDQVWSAPVEAGGFGRGPLPQDEHVGLRMAAASLWEGVRGHVIRATLDRGERIGEPELMKHAVRLCARLGPRCIERWRREVAGRPDAASGRGLARMMPGLLAAELEADRAAAPGRASGASTFEGARDGAVLVKQRVKLEPGEDLPATGTSDA